MKKEKTNSDIRVRVAQANDAASLVSLLSEIEYPADVYVLETRIESLASESDLILVAEIDEQIHGLLTIHLTPVLHRANPVARLTLLVVAAQAQGRGIGRALVEAGEREVAGLGCTIVEVISNRRYSEAHKFYERLGYELTSHKFKKILPSVQSGEVH